MSEEPGLDRDARGPRRVLGTLAVVLAVGAAAVLGSDALAPSDRLTVLPAEEGGLGVGGGLDVAQDATPAPDDAAPGEVALPDEVVDPAWTRLADAPLLPRDEHTLVWTGTEAITWGGLRTATADEALGPSLPVLFDGAAYDPGTDRWRLIALSPLGFAPRTGHIAVWTGREMLVWGGRDAGNEPLNDGAAYDPAADSWRRMAPSPLAGRHQHSGVWTGSELVIWGGVNIAHYFDGAAYNPMTDTWRRLASSPLRGRQGQQAVWTGSEVLIWGGPDAGGDFDPDPAGAAYDPAADTWRTLPEAPLAGRLDHSATWAGGRLLIWGGMRGEAVGPPIVLGDGAAYDPLANTWTVLPQAPLAPRFGHSAVSTGDDLIVWGGVSDRFFRAGAVYDVAAGSWTQIGTSPIDFAARYPAVWTGAALLVWGGNPHLEGAAWYGPGRARPPVAERARFGGPPGWQPAAGTGGGPPWWEPLRRSGSG